MSSRWGAGGTTGRRIDEAEEIAKADSYRRLYRRATPAQRKEIKREGRTGRNVAIGGVVGSVGAAVPAVLHEEKADRAYWQGNLDDLQAHGHETFADTMRRHERAYADMDHHMGRARLWTRASNVAGLTAIGGAYAMSRARRNKARDMELSGRIGKASPLREAKQIFSETNNIRRGYGRKAAAGNFERIARANPRGTALIAAGTGTAGAAGGYGTQRVTRGRGRKVVASKGLGSVMEDAKTGFRAAGHGPNVITPNPTLGWKAGYAAGTAPRAMVATKPRTAITAGVGGAALGSGLMATGNRKGATIKRDTTAREKANIGFGAAGGAALGAGAAHLPLASYGSLLANAYMKDSHNPNPRGFARGVGAMYKPKILRQAVRSPKYAAVLGTGALAGGAAGVLGARKDNTRRRELKAMQGNLTHQMAVNQVARDLRSAGAQVSTSKGLDTDFGKARYYDPEYRRQRRNGAEEAALGIAGLGLAGWGGRGLVRTSRVARHLAGHQSIPAGVPVKAHDLKELRDAMAHGVSARRSDLALIGGGAASLSGAGAVRAHAERRGRPQI